MKVVLGALALLLAAVAALVASNRRADIPLPDLAIAVPQALPPSDMSIAILPAGRMHSRAGFAYEGGSLLEARVFAMTPVLVRHPRGDLLIDAGFGSAVQEHLQTTPLLMRALSRIDAMPTAAEQLKAGGYDFSRLRGVLLTHAHWDHVSGLADMPSVPALLPQAELDFVRACSEPAALACSLGERPWQTYAFDGGPYLGFPASHDFYGDGAVVAVPAAGHTPGSAIVFVNLPDRSRYAFIGDIAWMREGVELPAQRPWLSRSQLREDAAAVRAQLAHLHQLQGLVPRLTIVPAHDDRVFGSLPRYAPG